jgi:23S rRNA C2498 (ribose-2'-O)-methylase RlmM
MDVRLLNVSKERLKVIDQGQIIFEAARKVSHNTKSGKKSNAWVVEQIVDNFLPMKKTIAEQETRMIALERELHKEVLYKQELEQKILSLAKDSISTNEDVIMYSTNANKQLAAIVRALTPKKKSARKKAKKPVKSKKKK